MTYTYKCEGDCPEYIVEESIKADAHKVCPKCGKPTKRLIRNCGVVVKCDGFFGKSD